MFRSSNNGAGSRASTRSGVIDRCLPGISGLHRVKQCRPSAAAPVVSIPWGALADSTADLHQEIHQGYGPQGLGLVRVTDIPESQQLTRRILRQAKELASLPKDAADKLRDPQHGYAIGLSSGDETGQQGSQLVSFYATPFLTRPDRQRQLMYPKLWTPTIYPDAELPEFKPAFLQLAQLMRTVGLLVAEHCGRYASSHFPTLEPAFIRSMLKESAIHKARLLHYTHTGKGQWLNDHTDFGPLTVLVPSLYESKGQEVSCPEDKVGLYVVVKDEQVFIDIPENSMVVQAGDALQAFTGGVIGATRHGVKAPEGSSSLGLTRSTMALFMQPDVDFVMHVPPGISHEQLGVKGFQPGMTFGEYADFKLNKKKLQK